MNSLKVKMLAGEHWWGGTIYKQGERDVPAPIEKLPYFKKLS